jgi:agmatinase
MKGMSNGDFLPTEFLNDPGKPPFQGSNTFFGLELASVNTKSDFGIIGIPMDFGSTFRVGQRFAPQKVRESSRIISGVDFFLKEDIFQEFSVFDYGDINAVPGYIDKSLKIIEDYLSKISKDVNMVHVGGDHLVTLPILRSLHKKFGKIELIDIDAHTDTWDSIYESEFSHANWLRKAIIEGLVSKVTQVSIRGSLYSEHDTDFQEKYGVNVYDMKKIRDTGFENVMKELQGNIESDSVYITLDIDAIDPAYAPGTGIPEPGGLTSWEIMSFFRSINFNAVGMDLVEIIPSYDHSDITSILGANLIFQYLSSQARLL